MLAATARPRFLSALITLVASLAVAYPAAAVTITETADAGVLTSNIVGAGITTSGETFTGGTGSPYSAGTFTGGLASGLGFDSGIILTTGDVSLADGLGPNVDDQHTGILLTGGDVDLSALVGTTTFDRTVLEFEFTSVGGDLFFNYAFASEEYNEFTNSIFNDVFAFYVDGVNIALLPAGADTSNGTQVSINTVNGGNPFGVGATNPDLYNNNDPNDPAASFPFQFDGFTDVFTAQALGLAPGTHHIKLAIADTSDQFLDSAVFIQFGSFSDQPPTTGLVPEPSAAILYGVGLTLAGWSLRRRES